MKKNLHLDEFETFLSDSVEGHRMYPSDRVWQHIDNHLERNRKWPALGFASAITGAIIMAGIFLLQPDKDLFEPAFDRYLPDHQQVEASSGTDHKHDIQPSWNGKAARRQARVVAISPAPIRDDQADKSEEAFAQADGFTHLSTTAANAPEGISSLEGPAMPAGSEAVEDGRENTYQAPVIPLNRRISAADELNPKAAVALQASMPEEIATEGLAQQRLLQVQSGIANPAKPTGDENRASATLAGPSVQSAKWSVQYYATPSISYRFINEERSIDPSNPGLALMPRSKVSRLVNHRPKMGMEAGVAWQYRVTEKLSLKMGVQANYRQFAIEAFEATPTPAILRVDQGQSFDTLYRMSGFANFGGGTPAELNNRYLQFAIPVGFELALTDGRKAQFVVGTTLQPTYVASQQTWLLSSDYQYYTKESSLMKRFNMNMGVEMLFRFKGAGLNWQVGPQVRYQMQPSVNTQYPIREHLVDYGLKFGVTKTLK